MGHGCNYQKNQCDIIPPFPTTIDFASRHSMEGRYHMDY